MKKTLKVILLSLSAVSLVGVIAVSVFLLAVNPNDFKPEIAAWINQRTGRVLSIPGDLAFSIVPALGITTGAMALSNAVNVPDKAFAEIAAAELSVKWLPLLSKKIELNRIVVRGLSLHLSKNKQGENNWDDLIRHYQENSAGAQPQTPATANPNDKPATQSLNLAGLTLEQGQISWDDQQAARTIAVTGVQLHTGTIAFAQPIGITLGFNVNAAMTHSINLTAQLTLDDKLNHFKINGLAFNSVSNGEKLPGGRLTLEGLVKAADYQHSQQAFTLEAMQIKAHNLTLNADFSGQQLRDNRDIQGTVRLADFNVKQFLQQQAMAVPATQDSTVLNNLAADFAVHVTDHAAALNKLNVKLDQTTLKGSAELTDFDHPALTFSAELDTLDADRYFAPKATAPVPILSSAVVMAATDQALPSLERLKKLSLNGAVVIQQLKMHQLQLQGVSLAFQGKEGKLQTQQTIKQLYQGTYQSNASLSFLDTVPRIAVDEKVTRLSLEPLLKALKSEPRLTGVINASAQLHAQGNSIQALKSSLTGDLQFLVENGVMKGFNVQKLIDNVASLVKGEALPAPFKNEQSLFSTLKGTAKVHQGVIENHDLVATSSNVAVNGEGRLDLTSAQIAYKLKARLLNAATPIKELNDWPLVLIISGTFDHPIYTVDRISAFLEKNKAKIEQKKDQLLEKLDKTLQKKLGIGTSELLKKLF
jgi:AsmA protein